MHYSVYWIFQIHGLIMNNLSSCKELMTFILCATTNTQKICTIMDPHFSRASSLDRQDSLLLVKILFLEKSESSLILFYFKGRIKQ